NPLFFPDPSQQLTQLSLDTQLVAPFTSVVPNSGTFWEGTVRNLGGFNGNGPDFEFQSEPSTSVVVRNVPVVPEPATLTLFGCGGRALTWVMRRRAKSGRRDEGRE